MFAVMDTPSKDNNGGLVSKDVPVEQMEKVCIQTNVEICYDCAWLSLTALSTVTCNLWL
jgi:hypothetical protein